MTNDDDLVFGEMFAQIFSSSMPSCTIRSTVMVGATPGRFFATFGLRLAGPTAPR